MNFVVGDRARFWWWAAYVLLLLLGLKVAISQPTFFLPDEGAHYLRAYEVRHLHLFNSSGHVGVDMPCKDYLVVSKKYYPIALAQEMTEEDVNNPSCTVKTKNTAGVYAFTSYVPGALGLLIGEKLGVSIENRLVIARYLGFLFFFTVLFLGVMQIGRGRVAIAFAFMLPGLFWQMLALSSDGATISACWLYVCLVLSLLQKNEMLARRQWITLLAVAIFIGLGKGAYSPICLVAFGLWAQVKTSNSFKKMILLLAPALLACASCAVFAWAADSLLVLGNGAQPSLQFAYVLAHPMTYTASVYHVFVKTSLSEFVAPYFAVSVDAVKRYLSVFRIVGVIVLFSTGFGLKWPAKAIFLLVFIIVFIAYCLPLYLLYTPPVRTPDIRHSSALFISSASVICGSVCV